MSSSILFISGNLFLTDRTLYYEKFRCVACFLRGMDRLGSFVGWFRSVVDKGAAGDCRVTVVNSSSSKRGSWHVPQYPSSGDAELWR